jgi:hypothetical protein
MKTLDQIVEDLVRTSASSARGRQVVLWAIATWLLISALALFAQSPGFFSRAGAVGTGLVLASFAYVTLTRQAYQTHLLKGLVLILRSDLRARYGDRPELVRQQGPRHEPDDPANIDHNLELIGRLFARLDRSSGLPRAAEVGAALTSTLQWGYGDLLINRLILCGEWQC